MAGENNPVMKLSKGFQSINLGLIPGGASVTETFDIELDNDGSNTSGPVTVESLDKAGATVTVVYKQLVPSPVPPLGVMGGGGNGVYTGSPISFTGGAVPLTDAMLVSTSPVPLAGIVMPALFLTGPSTDMATFGQSVSDLTSLTGRPYPEGKIYLPPPPPAVPSPATTIPMPPVPPVTEPGRTGKSSISKFTGMTSDVSVLPYPRSSAKDVTAGMGVLDLDTWTGRKYKLQVKLEFTAAAFDENAPKNNLRTIAVKFKTPAGDAEFTFGYCVVDPDARQAGEAPPGLPSYLMERIPS